jgi:hypothetical protein
VTYTTHVRTRAWSRSKIEEYPMYISKVRPFQLPPMRNTKRMNLQNPAGGCSSVQLVEPNFRYKDTGIVYEACGVGHVKMAPKGVIEKNEKVLKTPLFTHIS